MRRLFDCPDIVSLTEKFLMARNFFRIFTENNPARGTGKIYNMPDVNRLTTGEIPEMENTQQPHRFFAQIMKKLAQFPDTKDDYFW